MRVEDVVAGDRLLTLEGSYRPVVKIWRRRLSERELGQNPNLYPIRISAGALGHGLPRRDLLVSRQHRMLLSSKIVKRMFGRAEVLVAAGKLTQIDGVFVDTSVNRVEYVHVILDKHEVIFGRRCPNRDLPGRSACGSIDAAGFLEPNAAQRLTAQEAAHTV